MNRQALTFHAISLDFDIPIKVLAKTLIETADKFIRG